LAERAAGLGEPPGSEKHEREDQDDDQVGGFKDAGEDGGVLSITGPAAALGGELRPVRESIVIWTAASI
jgi:hypothetical protein